MLILVIWVMWTLLSETQSILGRFGDPVTKMYTVYKNKLRISSNSGQVSDNGLGMVDMNT